MLTDPEVLFSPHDAQVKQDRRWDDWFWSIPTGVPEGRRESVIFDDIINNEILEKESRKVEKIQNKRYTSLEAYGFDSNSGWDDFEENIRVLESFSGQREEATRYEHPLRHLSEWNEEVRSWPRTARTKQHDRANETTANEFARPCSFASPPPPPSHSTPTPPTPTKSANATTSCSTVPPQLQPPSTSSTPT